MCRRLLGTLIVASLMTFWSRPGTAEPTGVRLRIETIEDDVSGTLDGLGADSVTLDSAPPIPRERIISIEFPKHDWIEKPPRAVALLGNGDRLHVVPTAIDEETITLGWSHFTDLPPLKLPLETVRGCIVSNELSMDRVLRMENVIRDAERTTDLVLLKNQDQISGTLNGLDAGHVLVERTGSETLVPQSDVVAIALNPELMSFPALPKSYVLVSLTDSSRITFREIATQGGQLTGTTAVGQPLSLPFDKVARIQFFSGRIRSLAELKPTEIKSTPFFAGSPRTSAQIHRSAAGTPLRIRGVRYTRGIGVFSRSEMTWDLSGEPQEFRATIGIDDAAEGRGDVVFSVRADGQELWTSGHVGGTDRPLRMPALDLTGKRSLTLVVLFGAGFDVGDFANWCDPILVRK